jgi:hypothetical protein
VERVARFSTVVQALRFVAFGTIQARWCSGQELA